MSNFLRGYGKNNTFGKPKTYSSNVRGAALLNNPNRLVKSQIDKAWGQGEYGKAFGLMFPWFRSDKKKNKK